MPDPDALNETVRFYISLCKEIYNKCLKSGL